MNYPRLFFTLFIFLTASNIGCKNKKKAMVKMPSIDFKILANKAIELGELKIYPIINNSKIQNKTHVSFAEAVKKRGFNMRKSISGQGVYTTNNSRENTLYFANKSNKSSVLLLGDLAQDADQTFIAQESVEVPTKTITEAGFINMNSTNYRDTESFSLTPLFPCPPVPLRNLLNNKTYLTIQWLQEALPLLDFPVRQELKTIDMDLNLFSKNNNERVETIGDRESQANIGDLETFLQRFAAIGENELATGCIVTYKDTILISYVFAEADFFKREWPYISTSIYLNQLMGYHPTEMQSFTPFVDVTTSSEHIHKLWQQDIVMPKDNAYRGAWDGVPFYLVWF